MCCGGCRDLLLRVALVTKGMISVTDCDARYRFIIITAPSVRQTVS